MISTDLVYTILFMGLCVASCIAQQTHRPLGNSTSARIIGGKPAKKGSFPEFVFLTFNFQTPEGIGQSVCGGTSLKRNLVLTAAHCVEESADKTFLNATVYKGSIRKDPKTFSFSADHIVTARKAIEHPKFNKQNGYDIAILVLEQPLPKPYVKLPRKGAELPIGAKLTVVGFGRNNNFMVPVEGQPWQATGSFPDTLYQVTLTLGEANVMPCPMPNTGPTFFESLEPKKEMCLYGDEFYTTLEENYEMNGGIGIKTPCFGDSGGPSFYKGVQYGVVSGGDDLCSSAFRSPYSLHTKTSAHVDFFIRRVIQQYAAKT